MKKVISILIAAVLVMSLGTGLSAQDKELNVFGNLGFAFSDVEGLFLNAGVEKQMTDNIFVQFFVDYYFDPSGENFSGYGVDASVTLTCINFFAAYKKEMGDKLKLFVNAGPLLALSKVTASAYGFSISDSTTDFGIGAGAGIEYSLQEKLSLVAGAALNVVFSDETGTWFKLFGGINYKLKN
jgi:opacity protein-like surface antigen